MNVDTDKFTEDEDLEYYRSIKTAPLIAVEDEDCIEVVGHWLYVHERCKASKVKGIIKFTAFQWRTLLRQMIEDDMPIEDWSSVDLFWLDEG